MRRLKYHHACEELTTAAISNSTRQKLLSTTNVKIPARSLEKSFVSRKIYDEISLKANP